MDIFVELCIFGSFSWRALIQISKSNCTRSHKIIYCKKYWVNLKYLTLIQIWILFSFLWAVRFFFNLMNNWATKKKNKREKMLNQWSILWHHKDNMRESVEENPNLTYPLYPTTNGKADTNIHIYYNFLLRLLIYLFYDFITLDYIVSVLHWFLMQCDLTDVLMKKILSKA
jgi:hypothetical protein